MKSAFAIITLAAQLSLAFIVALIGVMAVVILEERRDRDGAEFPHR